MRRLLRYFFISSTVLVLVLAIRPNGLTGISGPHFFKGSPNTLPPAAELARTPVLSGDTGVDTTKLPYPFEDADLYPVDTALGHSKLELWPPKNLSSTVEYDPQTNEYRFSQKVGDIDFRRPTSMSFDEYRKFEFDMAAQSYWRQRAKGESFTQQQGFLPKLNIGSEVFDKIFGSSTINIQPQGSAELIFGVNISKTDNPTLPEKLRRTVTFDFKEKIQMNVTGTIGDKMKIQTNYNTESTFDFENKMNLRYEGKEDEIIRLVEAGDVTLPLSGSLITGSQSLFGIKTELQFGKLSVTSVFSQQKGESSQIEVQGGAQLNDFEVTGDNYEGNKHFFLSQYFKDRFDESLRNLPVITSGININKIEVWVTNKNSNFSESRNIVAFLDLAEGKYLSAQNAAYGLFSGNSNIFNEQVAVHNAQAPELPDNGWNDLYEKMSTTYSAIRDKDQVSSVLGSDYFRLQLGFVIGQDFEKLENARKLTTNEYTLNSKLGFITVNAALNADEVLAVAYEYTVNGKSFRVGEFSTDGPAAPQVLFLKLLKGTNLSPKITLQTIPPQTRRSPTWELMMKNVYSIGSYSINPSDFQLQVMYQNDKTGSAINYIPEGPKPEAGGINSQPLIQVLNLDNLNSQLDPQPDGFFDFVEGVTILAQTGRVIFPVRQPFGSYLRQKITGGDASLDAIADKYVYQELYDSTQSVARQSAEKNKFFLKGQYQSSSSSEISLNAMNVPQGSVKVTAGGMQLTENQDYTVDYTLGRVKIINLGLLESGTPISISLESQSMFNIQTKTLLGTHLNYKFNKDFNLGATILNLTERPLTSKVNIGDEPISNTIWGVDGTFRSEAPFLTKLIDKLPFIQTKEASNITMMGEFAHLIPGHSKALSQGGTAYIDDFEGSKTTLDIKNYSAWVLASTPQFQTDLFPEASLSNNLAYGFNRARLSWYSIDPLFLRTTSATPGHIKQDANTQSSHFVREVFEEEIFPNKQTPNGIPTNISVLNLAFYPEEKGPYNFELGPSQVSSGLSEFGTLLNPKSRWGGIQRKLETNDFEASNIEFIEFWMMDPFAEDADSAMTGGTLYFNLGNVSEDILRDSRKSFENGLPINNTDTAYLDTTVWGRVPMVQSLVNAFDNNNTSRSFQDIGLDGLNSTQEQSFFTSYLTGLDSLFNLGLLDDSARIFLQDDPAQDDYHYYRGGDYDSRQLGILDRYKKFNGLEGNSPTSESSPEAYPTSATTIPDNEDINRDNTLSETEAYYQYQIPITYQNLRQDKEFITDVVEATVTLKNGKKSKVKWYQFKIPVYEPDKIVGSISDFKSIRFIRMFMRGFEQPTILRFARLDLVRGEWRKYNLSLKEGSENLSNPQPTNATFDVSAVNIEENGFRTPVNYVLPPGIDRVIDPTNPQLRQLNEQSIVLKVIDLADGDARAAYRNVTMDVRQYKRLKLEVHAEEISGYPLNDDQLTVFIRLGSDYKQNFYEYEIPLKLTLPGNYNNDRNSDRLIVWPEDNRFDIDLEQFLKVKQLRNDEIRQSGSSVDLTSHYWIYDETRPGTDGNYHNKVTVVGNPNLSNIRTIMIGVRNPNDATNDDPKSGEIWLNEFRLSDFDETGGWAAQGRIMAKMADLGVLTVAGSTSKPGFGSIEKKVNERQKEEIYQYDISTNLEMGRFLPEKSGLKLPMYLGYSESFRNPQYNPLDPDIPFSVALDNAPNKHARDSIKRMAQDYTMRKSLNFTNIQVVNPGGGASGGGGGQPSKPSVFSITNWSATYSYSEIFTRNINTEYNRSKDHRGLLSYNFNTQPENVSPFKDSKGKFMRSSVMRLIKDFNFYYLPQQMSFRTDVERAYQEIKLRNISSPGIIIPATYRKDFTWNRQYDMRYDFSRSLKLDFSATNNARIDEPDGMVDKRRDPDGYQVWKDSVWTNVKKFGRTTQYNHLFNANWNAPINRLPGLDWLTASVRYNATFNWLAGPITADTIRLGNTIKNTNNLQLNGQINLTTLYNKVGFLKRIQQDQKKSQAGRQGGQKQGAKKPDAGKGGKDGKDGKDKEDDLGPSATDGKNYEQVEYVKDGLDFKANVPRVITHSLGTEDVQVSATDSAGQKLFGVQKVVNENRVSYTLEKDANKVKIVVKGRRLVRENIFKLIAIETVKLMMSLKNVSVSYSQTNGTLVPGYLPKTRFLGLIEDTRGWAPGLPFVFGKQSRDFIQTAAGNGWITNDSTLNAAYAMNSNETWNIRGQMEPVPGLRIDLNANRTFTKNSSEFYSFGSNGSFSTASRTINGSFNMSIISWGTAFKTMSSTNYSSEVFQNFLDYRFTIADRLRRQRELVDPSYSGTPDPLTGFPDGFGKTSQQVLVPAFLAAYTKTNPDRVSLETFPSLLSARPNWRITYDGLSKIEWFKKYFRTISIMHSYRSTFSVGSYNTNLLFEENASGISITRDALENFRPRYEINGVSINEQFSPLISIDMTWNNSLTTKVEFKKTRNLTLSFSNNQLTEVISGEYVVGAGYRIKDLEFIFKSSGGQKKFKSDLTLRADFSLRNNKTVLRKIVEEQDQLTAGQRVIAIKTSADYVLSDRFNLQFFVDTTITKPFISLSYPTSQTNIGFSLRFQLVN